MREVLALGHDGRGEREAPFLVPSSRRTLLLSRNSASPVFAVVITFSFLTTLKRSDIFRGIDRVPERRARDAARRVEVRLDRAAKQDWLLRDDGQGLAESSSRYLCDIETII